MKTPIISICGWKHSGKTWLLEHLIRRFHQNGYSVGVVKHDAHNLSLDHEGKDTYRLWQSGCLGLAAHDSHQYFSRIRDPLQNNLLSCISILSQQVDFILLEGHKSSPYPKIWLEHPEKPERPSNVSNVIASIPWDSTRLETAEKCIVSSLSQQWEKQSIHAGILTGGQSTRMGYPKHQMQYNKQFILDKLIQSVLPVTQNIVLLGTDSPANDHYPVLRDIPDCEGPLSGILSAMRWNPNSPWLFLACDMPGVKPRTIQWIVNQRTLGKWGIVPKDNKHLHPLLALYEPQCKMVFENAITENQFSLKHCVNHDKIDKPFIPEDMHSDWVNWNYPNDVDTI